MNIFLDANIVYKDPLFKKSYPKKLLEYAEHGLVNIYVSNIVKDEILNNHKVELQKSYSQYQSAIYNLNDFLPETFVSEVIVVEDNHRGLFDFYSKLEEKGIIKICTYDNSLLPKIIQRSLDKKKPFATNKTELRDATIWLSIVEYIQNNNLKDCVLISNIFN